MRSPTVLVAAALLAACMMAATAVRAGDWSELFVLDCQGSAHVFGSQPLKATVDVTHVHQAVQYVQRAFQARAKCRCPTLSQDMLNARFGTDLFSTLLHWAAPWATNGGGGVAPPYDAACQRSSGTSFLWDAWSPGSAVDVALPSTCSSASWDAGQPCAFSYPFGNTGGSTTATAVSQLNFMFDHCPATMAPAGSGSNTQFQGLPYMSLTCTGPRCADFGRPCRTSADCNAGTTCGDVLKAGATSAATIATSLGTIFRTLKLYGADATCPDVENLTASGDTLGLWVLHKLLSTFVTDLFGQGAVSDTPNTVNAGICGGGGDFTSNVLTGNDFNRCTYPRDPTTGEVHVNCGFVAWDGVLPGGEAANSASRRSQAGARAFLPTSSSMPSPTVVGDGVFNVVRFTCDNRMGAYLTDTENGGLHVRAVLPQAQRVAQAALNVVRDLQQCRAGNVNAGAALMPEQFDARFSPLSMTAPLAFGTVHEPFSLGNTFSDLYHYITTLGKVATDGGPYGPVNATAFPMLRMPRGCTLRDWLSNGRCTVQFNGLNSLFQGADITLRADIRQCPGTSVGASGAEQITPATMSVAVDCVGADCASLLMPYKWTYCTQDSDCPAPRAGSGQPAPKCVSITPLLKSLQGVVSGVFGGQQPPFLASVLWQRTATAYYKAFDMVPPQDNPGLYTTMSLSAINAYAPLALQLLVNAHNDYLAMGGYCVSPPCANITTTAFDLWSANVSPAKNGKYTLVVWIVPGRMAGVNAYSIFQTFQAGSYDYYATPPANVPTLWSTFAPNAPVTPFQSDNTVLSYKWFECPSDGSYKRLLSQCPAGVGVPERCDTQGEYEKDVIQFVRILAGQSPLETPMDTSATALRGYCTLAAANVTAIKPWSKAALREVLDPATGLYVSELSGLSEYIPCDVGGCSVAPRRAAAPSAWPIMLLCAAAVAVYASLVPGADATH